MAGEMLPAKAVHVLKYRVLFWSPRENDPKIRHCLSCNLFNGVFPKIDHSGNDARIVLEQNKLGKKVSSNGA